MSARDLHLGQAARLASGLLTDWSPSPGQARGAWKAWLVAPDDQPRRRGRQGIGYLWEVVV